MIKYFVRTTNERKLDETYAQIKFTKLVDLEHKPVDSFISQLKQISKYDSVLLEDDLILCKDFKNKIEEAIAKYPNYLINFFYMPMNYTTTHIANTVFRFNQCTYYPKGISKLIADEMEKLYKTDRFGYAIIEDEAIQKLNLVYVIYRPCLIQHIGKFSLLKGKERYLRQTIYFSDYLDELGITYDEAYKYKDDLVKLLEERNKSL